MPEPIAVPGITDAIAVRAGGYHTCALRPEGRVACWGRGEEGQIGIGVQPYVLEPSTVQGISEAVQLATGGYHSCAKLANGTVECWGKGSEGQLGNCSFRDQTMPVRVVRAHVGARLDGRGAPAAAPASGLRAQRSPRPRLGCFDPAGPAPPKYRPSHQR